MTARIHPLLVASTLALLSAQCGGGSTPASQTAEARTSSQNDAPENSGARASQNLTDGQIAKITDDVHAAEIEQARLAQQKTENEQVRQFAATMIDQHSQARQQESKLDISTEESALSRELQTHSNATVEKLKGKQGADFDRAYLEAQVEAHQQALDTIHNELRPNAQSAELQAYLQQLEPQVAQHLEHAKRAEQSLDNGAGNTRGMPSTTRSGD